MQPAALGLSRNAASRLGRKCATVTRSATISSASASGSSTASWGAVTTAPPCASGKNSSHSAMSNAVPAVASTRGGSGVGNARPDHSTRFTSPAWGASTPLGPPVEPEV